MISKSAEERADIIARRKKLISSKKRQRFPKWTVEEIKFLYGVTNNLHPISNLTMRSKRPSLIGASTRSDTGFIYDFKRKEVEANGSEPDTPGKPAPNKPDTPNGPK